MTDQQVRRLANLIALVCLAVFLVATYTSTTALGTSCGNWLSPDPIISPDPVVASLVHGACAEKLASRRLIALLALAVGLVVKIGLPRVMRPEA